MLNQYNKKGFSGYSLIELMVVLAIIGVLTSIATPIYLNYTIKSNVSSAVSVLEGIKNKAIEFYTTHNAFPIKSTDSNLGLVINYSDSLVANITLNNATSYQKADQSTISPIIGYIEANFGSGDKVPEQIKNTSIALIAKDTGTTISWQCASKDISTKSYLPSNCQ